MTEAPPRRLQPPPALRPRCSPVWIKGYDKEYPKNKLFDSWNFIKSLAPTHSVANTIPHIGEARQTFTVGFPTRQMAQDILYNIRTKDIRFPHEPGPGSATVPLIFELDKPKGTKTKYGPALSKIWESLGSC